MIEHVSPEKAKSLLESSGYSKFNRVLISDLDVGAILRVHTQSGKRYLIEVLENDETHLVRCNHDNTGKYLGKFKKICDVMRGEPLVYGNSGLSTIVQRIVLL
jgi:hypothetical protein